ncbi:cystathionine beta-lyase family protein involved in aluminum resistance [Salibacterium salarium]|uniref:methionine gamma-lyase family protein n=1 Tax=Salibacterium salarium TaxID=284579 RepID=UPI002783C2F5|nr:methionine gamma-lyase family protein [Salibacterium salarium]MDQ0299220.1 cystathionine beta-lyase family protein involved in aluminum resistance [Salibacterium salarium]
MSFSQELQSLSFAAQAKIKDNITAVEQTAEKNQMKILRIFKEEGVSAFHFQSSTGYGYDDTGRETLDRIYAKIFGTEMAIVRPQFISGTHAITAALFGVLRPGDHLLYAGKPYDTLETAIGISGNEKGTMKEFGISSHAAPLDKHGYPDADTLVNHLQTNTKVVALQRSKGYADRPSMNISYIKDIIAKLKKVKPDLIIFVDNCYGEFVEEIEPGHVGADLLAGSLIKNPGGGLVRTGGYVAGKADYIEQASARFAAPGIGLEGGATLNSLLEMYQGVFMAPHVVSEALKGAHFTASLLEEAGLKTVPASNESRTDLIQAVMFENKERMIRFCQAIQEASPVDSRVTPQPSAMPGYEDEVIMAAGAFIQGSSIELSADGPIRAPYTAYVQGGLTTAHVKFAVMYGLETLMKEQLIELPSFQ